MNYEEFLNEAKDSLVERLSEGRPGISVEITDVKKLQNHSYRGLSIREKGRNVGMSMDLMPFYSRMQDGEDKRFVMESFFREVRDRMDDAPAFDVDRLQDYEKMRDSLSIQREPASIRSMAEVMAELMPPGMELPRQEPALYVAAAGQTFGAGVLAYPGFTEMAAEQMNGDYFILPSSIHELLLIPDNGKTEWRDLEEMVKNVNESTVDPEERLSDHVYHYDSTKTGLIADSDNETMYYEIANNAGVELPSTGGRGTTLIYLLGIMMLALAGGGLVMRRKRRA